MGKARYAGVYQRASGGAHHSGWGQMEIRTFVCLSTPTGVVVPPGAASVVGGEAGEALVVDNMEAAKEPDRRQVASGGDRLSGHAMRPPALKTKW